MVLVVVVVATVHGGVLVHVVGMYVWLCLWCVRLYGGGDGECVMGLCVP